MRADSDELVSILSLIENIHSVNLSRPGCWLHETGNHLNGSCLSCTVVAKQHQHLVFEHRKTQTIYCIELLLLTVYFFGVLLHKVFDFQSVF